MPHFLRDEYLKNLTVDEQTLSRISQVFYARGLNMPADPQHGEAQGPDRFLSYIIRFDNKGYRVFDLQSLLNYFRQANYVERIIFTVESLASVRSKRMKRGGSEGTT
jgi:hypothetical protein